MIHLDIYPPTDITIDNNDEYTYASVNSELLSNYLSDNKVKIPKNELYWWYVKHLHRHTKINSEEGYLTKYIQKGGVREKISDEIVALNVKSNKAEPDINVKISRFLLKTDTGQIAELYLLAPESVDLVRHCVSVKICGRIADIDDLNEYYRCTDQDLNPIHAGSLFLSTIIRYLRDNKHKLDISMITVSDNSHKPIFIDKQKYAFRLEYSRQLEGKKPYYMSFGFLPIELSAYVKIHNNRNKMLRLRISDYITEISTIIQKYRELAVKSELPIRLYDEMLEHLTEWTDELITHWIIYIRNMYIRIFNQIYVELFKLFELKALNDEENNYYLDI